MNEKERFERLCDRLISLKDGAAKVATDAAQLSMPPTSGPESSVSEIPAEVMVAVQELSQCRDRITGALDEQIERLEALVTLDPPSDEYAAEEPHVELRELAEETRDLALEAATNMTESLEDAVERCQERATQNCRKLWKSGQVELSKWVSGFLLLWNAYKTKTIKPGLVFPKNSDLR